MNFLREYVQTPFAAALGWALFHFLWQGALIALALAAILSLFRPASARVRCRMASMALFLMPVAFGLTLAWSLPDRVATGAAGWRGVFLAAAPVASTHASRLPWWLPGSLAEALPWLVPFWAAGVLLVYARHMGGWFAAHRLRRRGVSPAPAAWQERLRRLAEGVGVSKFVTLWESSMTDVPVVIGFFRPLILLPLGLVAGLPPRQLEFVLLHELAHIRRNDYLVNLLQKLVEGLLFYHPAVWWVSGLVRAERENCCDDVVMALGGDAPGYAAALAALEEGRPRVPVPAATGGSLVQRIRRLLAPRETARVAVAPVFAAGLLLTLAAVGLARWADDPPAQVHPSPSPAPVMQQNTTPPAVMQQSRPGMPDRYRAWLNEDVGYIITAEERKAFEALSADAERDHFIEQFWKRRDPTPGTPRNEFKEEHYRRIAYASKYFATNKVAGWMTDRGHIYISYGPPDAIEDHPSGGGGNPNPWMVWRYRYIEGIGANVMMEFTDPERSGEFRMTLRPR